MATVRLLPDWIFRSSAAGIVLGAVLASLIPAVGLRAQDSAMHWQHAGALPPGAIGELRLGRGGPLPGYFQPVLVSAPQGARIAWAEGGRFVPGEPAPIALAMQIAPVYRLRITDIPNNPGMEVFPTVEVIDRLYPPVGQEERFPIPIQFSLEELELALDGMFVTRVIYVEDPHQALPHAEKGGETNWFEAAEGDDPLAIADQLGRPVAIVRIGGRVPQADGPDEAFLGGSPPVVRCRLPSERRGPPLPKRLAGPPTASATSDRHPQGLRSAADLETPQ